MALQIWLGVIVALLAMILVSLLVVLYQLVKQQGRLLLRMDELGPEAMFAGFGGARGLVMPGAQAGPGGLTVGEAAPEFELPDLDGRTVALKDFHGKRTLAVHWSSGCGYCHQIAPDLAALQEDLVNQDVQMVMLSYGEAESNRKVAEEHGLKCPILLQAIGAPAAPLFASFGTPVAYLLDEHGKVAEPIAVGTDQVPALARRVASETKGTRKRLPGRRSLAESAIQRDGLKPGTPAPGFTLPDLDGQPVSLDFYRGRHVLLVFSDPRCGPCDQLASRLGHVEAGCNGDGLAILMISRGDVEENRQKARTYRFPFRVAMQNRWEISKEYGIFATPVAFLIDQNGVIERPVAKGVDDILALVAAPMASA